MTTQTYKTRTGLIQYQPVMNESEYRESQDESMGFCLSCGAEAYGVEPDARRYDCQACGQAKVYGLEELLIMGLVKLVD